MDGNVVRVLARVRAIGADPKAKTTIELFWRLAKESLDPIEPGDFNQAWMDLGATICTPTTPSCVSCPTKNFCLAYLESISKSTPTGIGSSPCQNCTDIEDVLSVTRYPAKTIKKESKSMISLFLMVRAEDTGDFLLLQRPEKGLLAGLWQFLEIQAETIEKNPSSGYLPLIVATLKEKYGLLDPPTPAYLGHFSHLFTHIKQEVFLYLLTIPTLTHIR